MVGYKDSDRNTIHGTSSWMGVVGNNRLLEKMESTPTLVISNNYRHILLACTLLFCTNTFPNVEAGDKQNTPHFDPELHHNRLEVKRQLEGTFCD